MTMHIKIFSEIKNSEGLNNNTSKRIISECLYTFLVVNIREGSNIVVFKYQRKSENNFKNDLYTVKNFRGVLGRSLNS